jgi:hypothetical protein
MSHVMVRYKVKPDRVTQNEDLVRAVYEELGREAPDGIRYASFRLDDGVSFVHFAVQEAAESPLTALATFQRFQADIRERCDEPPVVIKLEQVGSYRL